MTWERDSTFKILDRLGYKEEYDRFVSWFRFGNYYFNCEGISGKKNIFWIESLAN